jgi:hypothetical protein
MLSFKQFLTEGLAEINKDDETREYVFISPSGKEVLRVSYSDLSRAQDFKMHYMRKKRWKFKGDVNADF